MILEIEDMVTHKKGLVKFKNTTEARSVLLGKGFKELIPMELYGGHSIENGNEICVMEPSLVDHNYIKNVK